MMGVPCSGHVVGLLAILRQAQEPSFDWTFGPPFERILVWKELTLY